MPLIASLLAGVFGLSAANGVAQLLPAGDFSGRDGRPGAGRKWRVDDVQGRALAAQMNVTAARTPIVIDYDHQTLNAGSNGAKAPAAGWIHGVEWRDGRGLFARVEWTPAAKAHIEAGEYRYISPVIFYDKQTLVVTGVAMASLVNLPALLGMDAATTAALDAFCAASGMTAVRAPAPAKVATQAGAALSAEAERLRVGFGLTVQQWGSAAERSRAAAALSGRIAEPLSADAEKLRWVFGVTSERIAKGARAPG